VRFATYAAGTFAGTLTLRDDAPGAPHVIMLSGTGIEMTVSDTRPDRPGRDATPTQTSSSTAVPVIAAEATPVGVEPAASDQVEIRERRKQGSLDGSSSTKIQRQEGNTERECPVKKSKRVRNARQRDVSECFDR